MECGAAEISDDDQPTKKCVKIDGAWQRRGYSSLSLYVLAVVKNKCVDFE